MPPPEEQLINYCIMFLMLAIGYEEVIIIQDTMQNASTGYTEQCMTSGNLQ